MTTAQRRPVSTHPKYEIDEYGRVFRFNKERKPQTDHKGYLLVELWKGSVGTKIHVARLVAIAFVSNPNNYDQVDHIDRNPLNNHSSNLRWVNTSKNNQNSRKQAGPKRRCTSMYKGVSRCNKTLKWKARIKPENGKQIFIGMFGTEVEAAKAYNAAALIHFGEHACVNRFN